MRGLPAVPAASAAVRFPAIYLPEIYEIPGAPTKFILWGEGQATREKYRKLHEEEDLW